MLLFQYNFYRVRPTTKMFCKNRYENGLIVTDSFAVFCIHKYRELEENRALLANNKFLLSSNLQILSYEIVFCGFQCIVV